MGTIGLSFGSPTSGEGINVANTVAQMVTQLQGTETPYKKQLTALAVAGHRDLQPGQPAFHALQ